jgi:hypothetical protein
MTSLVRQKNAHTVYLQGIHCVKYVGNSHTHYNFEIRASPLVSQNLTPKKILAEDT